MWIKTGRKRPSRSERRHRLMPKPDIYVMNLCTIGVSRMEMKGLAVHFRKSSIYSNQMEDEVTSCLWSDSRRTYLSNYHGITPEKTELWIIKRLHKGKEPIIFVYNEQSNCWGMLFWGQFIRKVDTMRGKEKNILIDFCEIKYNIVMHWYQNRIHLRINEKKTELKYIQTQKEYVIIK
jgi:hypothetical protein